MRNDITAFWYSSAEDAGGFYCWLDYEISDDRLSVGGALSEVRTGNIRANSGAGMLEFDDGFGSIEDLPPEIRKQLEQERTTRASRMEQSTARIVLRAINGEQFSDIDFGTTDEMERNLLARYGITESELSNLRNFLLAYATAEVPDETRLMGLEDAQVHCQKIEYRPILLNSGRYAVQTRLKFDTLSGVLWQECVDLIRGGYLLCSCRQCGKLFLAKTKRGSQFCSASCREMYRWNNMHVLDRELIKADKRNKDAIRPGKRNELTQLTQADYDRWYHEAQKMVRVAQAKNDEATTEACLDFLNQTLDEYINKEEATYKRKRR